jgi:acetyl-CoA carboxylase biotin carboxyl carrier protein
MDDDLIRSLIAALAASDLAELEYSRDGETLRLTRRVAAAPAAGAPSTPVPAPPPAPMAAPMAAPPRAPAPAAAADIRAPLYGVVHLRPAPDAAPFVAVGQSVRAGQTLCVIEAMKVFNELRAERDGTLLDVLVQTGQEVEIGQTLFRLG